MCQNSGLGNCVNPLTSLNYPFRIPTLLITTWRGQPGVKDEPQHELMSQITQSLLETMRIRNLPFPRMPDEITAILDAMEAEISISNLPFGLVMEKGTVGDEPLVDQAVIVTTEGTYQNLSNGGDRPNRYALLETVLGVARKETAIIATTGKCGRELFTIADRDAHLYQVGSMGCASGMGLGVALNTTKSVMVLDGDGAALMKMGTLATIGAQAPANLVHVVLDNGVHDSTGGQATMSPHVNFAEVAIACGYRSGVFCDSQYEFEMALKTAQEGQGPTLIHAKIAPGSLDNLGRPTVKPKDVARRFQSFLAS